MLGYQGGSLVLSLDVACGPLVWTAFLFQKAKTFSLNLLLVDVLKVLFNQDSYYLFVFFILELIEYFLHYKEGLLIFNHAFHDIVFL